MALLPFYVVTLTHPTWEAARSCAEQLPPLSIPELRLDLFPDQDPQVLVKELKGRCLVTCRRAVDGGRWEGSEPDRMDHLRRALEGRPEWVDLEWDLAIPDAFRVQFTHVRVLRSVHTRSGAADLEARLRDLPEGDAYKWVGFAERLPDNARLKAPLMWARDRGIVMSAFLMGPKGIVSRAMQGAWGGSFTYAAPDDGPPAAPGQIPVSTLQSWRCHRIHPGHGLCGVLGAPVLHSRGPAFHNPRFQRAFKDLIYLPLECADAAEALEAMEELEILGVSLTSPLKESVPEVLGLPGPLNTLWRSTTRDFWSSANTDAEALEALACRLPRGPVLILGGGGVAQVTARFFAELGCPSCLVTRRRYPSSEELERLCPVGVVQATRLGLDPMDGLPFPEALEKVKGTLRWAIEWVYASETAFLKWAGGLKLELVRGDELFDYQAESQSQKFIRYCHP